PDEITKLFGEMTQQVINSREEKWYFGQGSSYLEVDFPSDNPGKVSKFNYTENSLKSENITDNKLEMLTKRIITTGEDLNTQFGVPKKKTITQDKEEWEYQSGYMKVLVQIDKATGKIKNHICQTAGRIPVQQPSQSK
ncbi:MAG: hypothetical protein Q8867_07355, partial [Bacteroidota bacterium]|nr:hypothetical protein [Bacteroidota bacterium]